MLKRRHFKQTESRQSAIGQKLHLRGAFADRRSKPNRISAIADQRVE